MFVLRWAGWGPLAADRWREPEPRGDTWIVDTEASRDTEAIIARITHSIQMKLWRRTELHYLGKGLHHGVYTRGLEAFLEGLRRQDRHEEEAALRRIATAAF